MESENKPQLTQLGMGVSYKTLQIKGLAGMIMPLHQSTREAVIVVLAGEAILKMPDADHRLMHGSVFIIPAKVEHSLEIKNDFEAVAIMRLDSEIKFDTSKISV